MLIRSGIRRQRILVGSVRSGLLGKVLVKVIMTVRLSAGSSQLRNMRLLMLTYVLRVMWILLVLCEIGDADVVRILSSVLQKSVVHHHFWPLEPAIVHGE